jgi:replication factor C subunit 1
MFTVKYRPKKLENYVGNKASIQPFIHWLLEWDPNNKKTKCVLVSGLNGVGKSLLVELILKKHDYNIVNLSIDEEHDKEYINQHIKPLLKTKKTFNGQENVLVVSDVDCVSGYGFMSTLTDCIKETQIPIICICDNRYDQSIKPILNYCFDIKLVKASYDEVYKLIYKVVTTENIKISKSNVDKLYEQANGDIRFILNALQLYNKKTDTSKNIQSSNIFETTGKLLSQETDLDDKNKYYWMSRDIHGLMIQENYISCTLNVRDDVTRLENLAYSADALSDADLLDNVFNFELEPYIALSTIRATAKCTKKAQIKFPQFLGRTSTINKNKRDKIDYETSNFLGENPKPKKEIKPKEPKLKEAKPKKEIKPKAKKEK